MRLDSIVGYVYQADIYCPDCILEQMQKNQVLTPSYAANIEHELDELAKEQGIDRHDEATFDSDDFPKIIFADVAEDDQCGNCGDSLLD